MGLEQPAYSVMDTWKDAAWALAGLANHGIPLEAGQTPERRKKTS